MKRGIDTDRMHRRVIIALFCLGLVLVLVSAILLAFPDVVPGNAPAPATLPGSYPASGSESGTGQPVVSASATGTVQPVGQGPVSNPVLAIRTTDISGGAAIPGVSLYINGLFAGTTSENGTFVLSVPGPDAITIRAVKEGYQERTVQTGANVAGEVTIALSHSPVIPLEINGPVQSEINIVFLPSNTSYNATENQKIELGGYPGGQPQFEADVRRFIANTFNEYPNVTSAAYPLPAGYGKKFNFYYFWDNATYGDAFDGCAGSIPQHYWNQVTYSDLTIILYPTYYGHYLGPPSQPIGCTKLNGAGMVYLKVPADSTSLGMLEIGHGLYDLVDTFCGDTYYAQFDPNPNVWTSLAACQQNALANSWNPAGCRQIASSSPSACSRNFWRYDPDPDIMHDGYDGSFGNASTKRIVYVLNRISQ